MVAQSQVASLLEEYGDDLAVVTVCSHSSLQLFHGARQEGFRTIGIAIGKKPPKFYDAFPRAKPDEFFLVDSYEEILDRADELVEKSAVAVPHGSFVEYMGAKSFLKLRLPTFGNRKVLAWESDREKQREWLVGAGIDMPRRFKRPSEIDRPVFVKYYGAKGGKGAFIAKTEKEFREAIKPGQKYTIQEYVVGTRYYIHFFFSPLIEGGYRLSRGSLEMLGIDRRDEPVHPRVPVLGPRGARDEHGPPDRAGDPPRAEEGPPGGRPDLGYRGLRA